MANSNLSVEILSGLEPLTSREFQVLGLMANGDSNSRVAEKLNVEERTVVWHLTHLYSKLELGPKNRRVYNSKVKAVQMYRERYQSEFIEEKVDADLTPRQREVLSLMAQGYSSQRIAKELFVEPRTVRHHITSVYSKLKIRDYEGTAPRVLAALMYGRIPKISGDSVSFVSEKVA